jgi:hypothetical protein
MRGCKKALSISEVKVDPLTLTNSNKKFFIFDFDGKNRILLFASPDGIKALSESLKWHADGQASIVTSMPETPVFDNNNNCVNYTTSQLEMIYHDTPVIGASSTINLTKKRKRQMDDNVCNEVKKLKDDTGLTSCNWCGNLYKVINRHRNFCKNKPTDIILQVQSKKFVSELV